MRRFMIVLASLAILWPTAHAVQWAAGLQVTGLNNGTMSGGPVSPGAALAFGAHLSGEGNLSSSLALRGTLEGNVGLNRIPEARLDLALLHHEGELYYGGGIGSGVVADFGDNGSGLPGITFSPLTLLNGHVVLGRNFGTTQVEGLLRLGLESAVDLRVNFLLP